MNSSNNNSNSKSSDLFFILHRNVHLRNKIFNYLGRCRYDLNSFLNGDIFYNYDDMTLSQLFKLGNRNLIKKKLESFKELFNSKLPLCIFDFPEEEKDDQQKQHQNYYKDWLDFGSNEIIYSIDIDFCKIYDNPDELDEFLSIVFKYYQLYNHEYYIEFLIRKYGFTKKRFDLYENYLSKKGYQICISCGMFRLQDGLEILDQLIKQKRICLKSYSNLIDDPFFYQYKDHYRLIEGWNDLSFFATISGPVEHESRDQNPSKVIEYIKWIVKVSPSFNFDLYKPSPNEIVGYSNLYGVKVLYSNKVFSQFDSIAHLCPEILQFIIDSWPSKLCTKKFYITINDIQVAEIYFNYMKSMGKSVCDLGISTTSNDPHLLQLFKSVGIVDYDRRKRDLIYHSTSSFFRYQEIKKLTNDPLTHIMNIYNDRSNGFETKELYDGTLKSLKDAFKQQRSDYINFYMEKIDVYDIDTLFIWAYYYGNMDLFDLVFSRKKDTPKEDEYLSIYRNLILLAIRKHDLNGTIRFCNFLQDSQRDSSYMLAKFLVHSYNYLPHANSQQKEDSIGIVEYFKSRVDIETLTEFVKRQANHNFSLLIFIQDIELFRLLNISLSDLQYYTFFTKVPPSTIDHIIQKMNKKELDRLRALLPYLTVSLCHGKSAHCHLKILIYLFSKFQSQLNVESVVEELCHMAMYYNNHALTDILLHCTKVRLQTPKSQDDDFTIMANNYKTMIHSTYYSRSTYFKTNTKASNHLKGYKVITNNKKKQFKIDCSKEGHFYDQEPLCTIPDDETYLYRSRIPFSSIME
ncbi:hypothetical protein CYY_008587 [Polysphondylium violaceum]|uniref:Uncharacterized protein n=1 Tax=Polysphondylium violaceum TaxID=133409 RepID=A0A8J4PLG7_9MYCE|nr:hypothetical protein CYY_008587 [Polysphondylium violaceum]